MTSRRWRATAAASGLLALLALLAVPALHPERWIHIPPLDADLLDEQPDRLASARPALLLDAIDAECPLCLAASRSRSAAKAPRPPGPTLANLERSTEGHARPLRSSSAAALTGQSPRAPPHLA
jgi:hypothetical protein